MTEPIHRSWIISAPLAVALGVAAVAFCPRPEETVPPPLRVDPMEPARAFAALVEEHGYQVHFDDHDPVGLWYISRDRRDLTLYARVGFWPGNEEKFNGVVMLSPADKLKGEAWQGKNAQTNIGGFTLAGDASLRRELCRLFLETR